MTAVYQYDVRDGWTLQPNFQYLVDPGGGATDPFGTAPGKALKDAAVSAFEPSRSFSCTPRVLDDERMS